MWWPDCVAGGVQEAGPQPGADASQIVPGTGDDNVVDADFEVVDDDKKGE